MEVGCPGTWGLELPTPNPGSKSTPKACPTHNPATSPARHTQPQPKHPSHRSKSSVEIIIRVIPNNNNKNNNNNNNVIIIKGRGGWEKTLKHSKNCNGTRIYCNNNADSGAQETSLHQAYYSNTNPDNRKRHSKPPKMLIKTNATLTTTQTCSLSLTKLNKYI